MVSKKYVLKNETGFHARPAGIFVKTANSYKSEIYVYKDGSEYNGKSIMGLLSMGATQGTEITLKITGSDEETAMEALLQLLEKLE